MENFTYKLSVSESVHLLDFCSSEKEISMEIWNTILEQNIHEFVFCKYSLDVTGLKKLPQIYIVQNINKQIFETAMTTNYWVKLKKETWRLFHLKTVSNITSKWRMFNLFSLHWWQRRLICLWCVALGSLLQSFCHCLLA